jgi:PKD repeat protein
VLQILELKKKHTMKIQLPVNQLSIVIRTLFLVAMFGYGQQALGQHCNPSYSVTTTNNTAYFHDQSTADGSITGYSWSFGDGNSSTQQHPEHTYSHAGVYEVCLTVFAHNPDCHATFCHHLTIEAHADTCHASYTVEQPDQHHLTFEFNDHSQSNSGIETWEWSFGDGHGSSDQNPAHTYAAPGTYIVCLTITDHSGCSSHFCHELVVHHPIEDQCEAAWTVHTIDHGNLIVNFLDQSSTDGHIISWYWEFGDGTTSTEQNPVHHYGSPGTYTVCLFITDDNGCTSHFCHDVVLHHEVIHCDASFFFHQLPEDQNTINFTDHSSSDQNIHSWIWDFGDGQTSSEQNPTHTYTQSGTYLVCLFITTEGGSCMDHYCHHVVIHHVILDDHNDHVAQRMPSNHDSFFKGPDNPSHSVTDQGESHTRTSVGSQDIEINDLFHTSPNPFKESIKVEFDLEEDAMIKVTMFDLTGKAVFIDDRQLLSKGHYIKDLTLGHLHEGIYILKVEINGDTLIRKVVKAK